MIQIKTTTSSREPPGMVKLVKIIKRCKNEK